MKRESDSWVVYAVLIKGEPTGANAVCEQAEWDAMEHARPGGHRLIRSGIPNEAVAERLARGTSGDPVPRAAPKRHPASLGTKPQASHVPS